MKSKILIIEDAPVIQAELIALLNGIDYEASAVTDFSATIQTMKSVDRKSTRLNSSHDN